MATAPSVRRRNGVRELFDALGIRPILGRGFRPEEGTGRNAHPVTVISYMTWKNRYKGDPDIIGKTQYMNGVQHTIIGVAPERSSGPTVFSCSRCYQRLLHRVGTQKLNE